MFVNLKRGWFAPSGELLTPEGNPHTVSASWEDKLPSSAVIVEGPVVEVEAEAAPVAKAKR